LKILRKYGIHWTPATKDLRNTWMKVYDNNAVREFYSILRAAIKGAKTIGWVDLLINDQTIPRIMGKMPFLRGKNGPRKGPNGHKRTWELPLRDSLGRNGKMHLTWLLQSPVIGRPVGADQRGGKGRGHNKRKPWQKGPWARAKGL
jgi:hypothetical protein